MSDRKQELIIYSGGGIHFFSKLKELAEYRDLLRMISYRDIRIRYAQTFLGIAWTIINPVLSLLLLVFVFGIVVKVDTMGFPPLLFSIAGLCSWNYFARVVGDAGNSLVGAQSLVKRIYFPRLIIPLSKVISGLIDLGIVLILIGMLMWYYDIPVSFRILWLIPLCVLTMLAGLAFGTWVAALTIRFRDFSQVVPIILRIGMFMSPIAYGMSAVPAKYHALYLLNPLTGIIEGFRWAILGTPWPLESLIYSIAVIGSALVLGTWYFFRIEKHIADII